MALADRMILPAVNGRSYIVEDDIDFAAGTAVKQRKWEMKQERKTPGYTTNWKDLIVAAP